LWLCAPSEEDKEGWIRDLNEEITMLKKKNEFYEGTKKNIHKIQFLKTKHN